MAINITFRSHLRGCVADFCDALNMKFFNNHLLFVDLIILLAKCREEGVVLFPQIYLSNDIRYLLKRVPDSEKIKVGQAQYNSYGVKEIVKKCSPIAIGAWNIYIESKENDIIEYGVFSCSLNPISIPIDEVLLENDDDLEVVKMSQISENCIEILANNKNQHYIFLDHRKDDAPHPLDSLKGLVDVIVTHVDDELKDRVVFFIKKILFDSLRYSHGCVIAVIDTIFEPNILSQDGVFLEERIDFANIVQLFLLNQIDISILLNKFYLISGMLNSDGIIIFSNSGVLLGYNCFVKISNSATSSGGARKRAFLSLKDKIGKCIVGLYFQSQDGNIEFERLENE